MDAKTIFAILILSLIALAILTVIGLVICLVADEITKAKIDKYMTSCGFTKEIDHIYHLNNGDKVFYKFTRPYYDGDGNIAMQTVKAEVVYRISYKQVKHTYSNRVSHIPTKITFEKD